jgi:hypothetical protein
VAHLDRLGAGEPWGRLPALHSDDARLRARSFHGSERGPHRWRSAGGAAGLSWWAIQDLNL